LSPTLEESYARCRVLARRHGTTYYWSANVLPAVKRHHVHALYAFCRVADDIVDDGGDDTVEDRERALTAFGDRLFADLERGESDDPVIKAVVHTTRAFALDTDVFRRFLRSMHMDLRIATYETYADLCEYMDGSAAVIGEMMLPILEPSSAAAVEPARALGTAFQLTNFLRDVGEDLQRGRVYVPQEDLRRFGADPHRRVVDDAWRDVMRYEIARARVLYEQAEAGLAHLAPIERRCIASARALYSGILDVIEARDYDVFGGRARVPTWRKVVAVAPLMARTAVSR
jgi:phytoene synthase